MSNIDKWVRDAFKDAVDSTPFEDPEEEKEYQAYRRVIVEHMIDILRHCEMIVGEDRMEALSGVVMKSGNTKTLAEFMVAVATLCFSLGYKEGKKEG